MHSKHKTEKNIKDPQKKYHLGTVSIIFTGGLNQFNRAPTSPLVQKWIKTHTLNINNTHDPQKKYHLGTVSKFFLLEGLKRFNGAPTLPLVQMWIKTHRYLVCMKDPLLINASSPRTY